MVEAATTKTRKGIISRIWDGSFSLHGDDFEKRLRYVSKEEANVLKKMNRGTINGRNRLRQLIYCSVLLERYDPDPAAKAAAASVLASKLGADSGLKVYMEDETVQRTLTGTSKDAEYMQTNRLRNRKKAHKSSSVGNESVQLSPEAEMLHGLMHEDFRMPEDKPLAVAHQDLQTPVANDVGWIAQFAALLVGEDPTQSYALICGICHMHNGLVRKEDFPFITYFCPHCQVLNQPKQILQRASGSSTPELSRGGGSIDTIPETLEAVIPSNEEIGSEIEEMTEQVATAEPDS